jgi:translocation protein SEC62
MEMEKVQAEAEEKHSQNGGAFIEEVPEAAPEVRPTRNRNAVIEEVEDDDDE